MQNKIKELENRIESYERERASFQNTKAEQMKRLMDDIAAMREAGNKLASIILGTDNRRPIDPIIAVEKWLSISGNRHLSTSLRELASPAYAIGGNSKQVIKPIPLTHCSRKCAPVMSESEREMIRKGRQWLCLFGKPSSLVGIDCRRYDTRYTPSPSHTEAHQIGK